MTESEALEIARRGFVEAEKRVGKNPAAILKEVERASYLDEQLYEATGIVGHMTEQSKQSRQH